MIQFILLLLGLACSANSTNTPTANQVQATKINNGPGGPVGGNSGQTPPPLFNP
ncbi:hypothetical protein P2W68_15590 [Chryseobacterium arthrosphaerae]|uniref:hypothetical protein n=1 Tax=Chryseobacterium arthrosphaerae TaxID=651561 RepID=UPI0023E1D1E4|nr:hypothetical protein [Chryseobacterium arthrosphaerae]WES96267.1 hypothetical protein P2W68_15590 [Chryseobacterium arthrosphaerae]